MTIDNGFALVIITGLLVYLLVALIFPRHF